MNSFETVMGDKLI